LLVAPTGASAPPMLTVATNKPSYNGEATIVISGGGSPVPQSSGVTLTITNPQKKEVNSIGVSLDAITGDYYIGIDTGPVSLWTPGTYMVNASWQSGPQQAYAFTTFSYDMYSVTVSVTPRSVSDLKSVLVFGTASSGVGSVNLTAVVITIRNPSAFIVASTEAFVVGSGATGTYSANITAGGTSNWAFGNYTVTATYGSSNAAPPATASTSFAYGTARLATDAFIVTRPPVQASVRTVKGVEIGFQNQYFGTLNGFIWVVVYNTANQTIGIFLGSVALQSGISAVVFVPTLGLPRGNYTASLFATTPAGVAISVSTTTPLSVS
jgi:hypothetical protein